MTAASATRTSALSVTDMTVAVSGTTGPAALEAPSGPMGGSTTRFSPRPTARMHACGGLITAVKSSIPNMPRLEMVNEPPWNSSGFNLPESAVCSDDWDCESERT